MQWRQMLQAMFPSWLNVIVFVPTFLFVVLCIVGYFHFVYELRHYHPTQHYITSQSKR